jgi:squalene-hopene/tetraprenyl-beta-curcumene cyclase
MSPIWDTALTCHALLEMGGNDAQASLARARWLVQTRFSMSSGLGDDVLMSGLAAGRSSTPIRSIPTSMTPRSSSWRWTARRSGAGDRYDQPIARAVEWVRACRAPMAAGRPSTSTTFTIISQHPVRRSRALIDPPTEDVTARCLSMFAQLGGRRDKRLVARGINVSARARSRTAAGTAAGASITSTAPGLHFALSMRGIVHGSKCARLSIG